MPAAPRDLTFISYSHRDKIWLDKLVATLKPLVRNGSVAPWADTRIQPGDRWRKEIQQALAFARVAVLLVSRDFLASDFIAKHELPTLLKKAKAGGLTVLWVHVSASLYEATEIEGYQAAHDISKPLDSLSESEQARVLTEIARKIWKAVGTKNDGTGPVLPSDGQQEAIKGLRPFRHEDAEIFARLGRQAEVDLCAGAIADPEFRFGILSGESGCGKSSFLQAGLWPKLETYGVSHRCVYVKFANEDPIETVKRALSETLEIPAADSDNNDLRALFKGAMQTSPTPLVLLFDQFEQFFVHKKYKQDRQPFVQAMADWYLERKILPVKIVVSIRGDFSDRLIELQTAMGYSIGPGQNFRLEKFEPMEAANVIKEIAEVEGLPVEEHFVDSMVNELAGRDDGLISPAYLQIMAWVIKRQKAADKRGFTSKAFQKIGGIEGLLERFLTDTLAARQGDMARQAVIKILVALIDLDRNARVGLMTVDALQKKLADTLQSREIHEAVEWLASQDVRLITQQEQKDAVVVYELAHECLIAAVRKLAGKQLSEADRANQILDRRVNEWLGNNSKTSYLLGWSEWRLVERNRPYLVWGAQRNQKEELLWRTRRKWMRHAGAIGAVLVMMIGVVAAWLSPWGQVQMMELDVAKLSRGNDQRTLFLITEGLTSVRYFEQAAQAAGRIADPKTKAEALGGVAKAAAQVGNPNQAAALLKEATEVADRIADPKTKAEALAGVAKAAAQVAAETKNAALLKEAAEIAGRIADSDEKAGALEEVARVTAQVAGETKNAALLKEAAEVADRIADPKPKAEALAVVARAAAQVAGETKSAALLKEAADVADRIATSSVRAWALAAVARTAAQVAGETKNAALLKEASEIIDRIAESSARAMALAAVARAAAQVGNPNQSAALLKEATEIAGRSADSEEKDWGLSAVARSMVQVAGQTKNAALLKEASEVIDRIAESSARAWALAVVARAAAQGAGQTKNAALLKEATEVADRIADPKTKAEALAGVAKAAAQVGDPNQAAALLKEAAEVADHVVTFEEKAEALGGVARAAAQVAAETKNAALLKEAAEVADRIAESQEKAGALSAVARTAAQLGHWRQARNYAELNTTNEGKANALIGILQVWHGADATSAEKENGAVEQDY